MGWTSISDTRTDSDSPVDEDLLVDLSDNSQYNYDHALRCGTDSSGVRLVLARGAIEIDETSVIADVAMTGTVTFATVGHADDGDPNFNSTPRIEFGFEEDSTGGYVEWKATAGVRAWGAVLTAVSSTAFSYRVQFENNSGIDIKGYVHWAAIAEPSTGE